MRLPVAADGVVPAVAMTHSISQGRSWPQVVRIEDRGGESWGGVALPDDGSARSSLVSVAGLAAGDAAVLVLFAAIGRGNHGEEVLSFSTFLTALPFMVGELVAWCWPSPQALQYFSHVRDNSSRVLNIPLVADKRTSSCRFNYRPLLSGKATSRSLAHMRRRRALVPCATCARIFDIVN